MIAGTGVAAAAWAAPSIVHFDVASAAGSGSQLVTVAPLAVPGGVVVTPNVTSTSLAEPVFGEFGRTNPPGNEPNGDRVNFAFSGFTHTSINVTVRVCYQSNWEQSGNGADTMDILFDGVQAPGHNSSNVGLDGQCIDYTFTSVAHTGPLSIDVIGDPVAQSEDFGVSIVMVEFC